MSQPIETSARHPSTLVPQIHSLFYLILLGFSYSNALLLPNLARDVGGVLVKFDEWRASQGTQGMSSPKGQSSLMRGHLRVSSYRDNLVYKIQKGLKKLGWVV